MQFTLNTLSILCFVALVAVLGTSRKAKKDRLPKISRFKKVPNVTCYECNSQFDGDDCYNLTLLLETANYRLCNQTTAHGGACVVQRVDTWEQSEGLTAFSIERSCASTCNPYCIFVGERYKIHHCISCCYTTKCNVGNNANTSKHINLAICHSALFFVFLRKFVT